MSIEFDVDGARKAGFSDREIADHLGKVRPNFDIAGARKSGYADDEIVHFMQTGKPFDRTGGGGIAGSATTFGRGIVKGAADTAAMGAATAALTNPAVAASEAVNLATGRPSTVGALSETISGAPRAASESLAFESMDSLPPTQRPFAAAGELVGASIPFAAAPIALAKAGLTVTSQGFFGRLFGGILDAARKNPKTFAAVEASSIAGGAQGAALAEAIAPGEDLIRVGAEVVGSVLNPAAIAVMPIKGGVGGIRRVVQSMSPEGRKRAAGNYVHAVIAQFGEDPVALTQALRAADEMGLSLPSGAKTGSPSLLALESNLAKASSPLDLRVQERIKSSLSSLRRAAEMLEARGDPDDLRQAAVLRERYYSQMIDGRMRAAEQQVSEARARFDPSTPGTRMTASQESFEALDGALRSAREVENELWNAVPKQVAVQTDGLRAQLNSVQDELLPGETISGLPQALIDAIGDSASMTSGQLIRLRSRLLEKAREARAQRKFGEGRQLSMLAEGTLDDLSTLPGHEVGSARAFSRELNDRFTRTFAGSAVAENRTGAARIPPEVLLDRAFGSGGPAASVRFREMREAAEFGGEGFLQPIVNAQENFLRAAASASRDPQTGAVNSARLERFIASNESALSRFPQLRDTLSDVAQAERAFRDVEALTGRFTRRIAQVDSFARLLDFENPAMAVGASLNGKNPVRDYNALSRFAARSGTGTTGGLRASTLDYAMNAASGPDGVSFNKLSVELLRPRSGRPALIDMMIDNKVISSDQAGRLRKIIETGRHIENRSTTRAKIDAALEAPGGLEDMITRIAGAKVAGVGARATGRAESLIAASAGSRFLRNLFQNVPATRTRDLLYEAVENPRFMADLLEAGKPPKEAASGLTSGARDLLQEARFRRMHSVLWQAGLVPESEPSQQ